MSTKRGTSTIKSRDGSGRQGTSKAQKSSFLNTTTMAIGVIAIGVLVPYSLGLFGEAQANPTAIDPAKLPATAQIINQKTFNVLEHVPPPKEANATTVS